MDLGTLAAALGLDGKTCDFMEQNGWSAAEACFDPQLPLLQDDFLLEQYGKIACSEDFRAALLTAADRARRSPELAHCVHYLSYYYYRLRFNGVIYGARLPGMNAAGEEIHGLLIIAVALGAIPLVEQSYAALGLPPEYARDTVQWLAGAISEYRAGHEGRFGLGPVKPHWMRHYIEGELFRVGRLEYMIQPPLNYLPAAYRRKTDGRVIALCRDGWRLRRDGLLLWNDEDPKTAFRVARLIDGDGSITGIPIDPAAGAAEAERTVTLTLSDYEPLWTPWSLVPGIHIPGGGRMTPEACRDSLHRAVEFFRRYFRREVAGFSCFSWIYNPDFERELPQSNLADFMRQVYLFPFPSVGVEGLVFAFGRQEADWSDYPADNSLHKAFHRIRESGRRLKAGGMFIEAAGLAAYGSEYYRRGGRIEL